MKVLLITITSVLIAITNCSAALTTEWEVDLYNMTGILGTPSNYSSDKVSMRIHGQSDGGVILHYYDPGYDYGYTNNLFVLNTEGELTHSVTNLYVPFTSYAPRLLTAHGNHIVLLAFSENPNWENPDGNVLYIIEMQESGYSATTSDYFRSESNYIYEERADTFFTFSEHTQMLSKYRIPEAPSELDSAVASGIDGSNYILNWISTAGASYQIQSSTNLTDWISVGDPIVGTGAPLTWANALTNSQSFYRIIEQ